MVTDPIADMLTRLRNGLARQKAEVIVPASKMKEQVLHILKSEGYLEGVEKAEDEKYPQGILKVTLKYSHGQPVMRHIRRVSSPGQRVYSHAKELKQVLSGLGISVVSTSKGIMTGQKAKAEKLGGEVLCKIW